MSNISKRIPAFPYDDNKYRAAILMVPIVSGGNIVDYLPVAAVDNGDGTASIKADTELVVENATITNVRVGSSDGQSSGNKYLKVLNDGTVIVRLTDTTGAEKNPATAENQATEIGHLSSIDLNFDVALSTRASEATLGAAKVTLDSILMALDVNLSTRASEATLTLVKTNTDGIITQLTTLNAKDFATEATLALIKAKTDNLDVALSTRATKANQEGVASSANSTTTPLGVGATFTGVFEEVKDFAMITVVLMTNVASATDGLKFDWSSDGVNVDRTVSSTVSGINLGRAFSLTVRGRYFRIRYVNNSVAQTTFRMQTVYHRAGSGVISRPIKESINEDNFAQLVRAVIAGESDGGFANAKVTDSGSLLVSVDPGSAPPDTTVVKVTVQTIISAATDTLYTIPNGSVLTISTFFAGGQAGKSGSKVELFEDVNGNLTVLNLLHVLYVDGNSDFASIGENFVGNGTRRILLRRTPSANNTEIFGQWKGYTTP